MAVRAKKFKTTKDFKNELKRNSTAGLMRVPKDGERMLRFLTDPDGWVGYSEHYDKDNGFYPCDDASCVGCDAGVRAAKKYAAAVYDIEGDKADVLSFGSSVAEQLERKIERGGTLTDRDIIIERVGSGVEDTKYFVEWGEAKNRSKTIGRLKVPDIEAILQALVPSGDGGASDDDDDEPPFAPDKVKKRRPSGTTKPRTRSADDDDDEDEDDDEPPKRSIKKPGTTRRVLKKARH